MEVFGILHKKLTYGEQIKSKPYASIFPGIGIYNYVRITEAHIKWIKKYHPDNYRTWIPDGKD